MARQGRAARAARPAPVQPSGPTGPSGSIAAVTVQVGVGADGGETAGVDCPGTARALGGGTSTTDLTTGSVLVSAPTEGDSTTDVAETGDVPTGWFAEWVAISAGDTVSVYAICAP